MAIQWVEHSTRTQILQFIKRKGRACILEISRALGVTPMGVRRHVARLQTLGAIRKEKQRCGRGRPADAISLTDLGDGLFPKAYDQFSMDLIRSAASQGGPQEVDRLFDQRRKLLVEKFAHRMRGKGREARVREAVAILCEEGYMAEFEKINARTFRITEHNCAIAQIAREYPQACQAELCLLAQMLQADVERDAHVLRGDLRCSYLAKFPSRRIPAA